MKFVLIIGISVLFAAGCREAKPGILENPSDGEPLDSNSETPQCTACAGDSDSNSDSDTGDETCVTVESYTITQQPINILILLDRSASMIEGEYEGRTYQEIVNEALASWVTNPVKVDYSAPAHLGLVVFPSVECQQGESVDPESQCLAADRIQVPLGPDGGAAIAEQLKTLDTCGGGTPICDTLQWVAEVYLPSLPAEQLALPTFLVLITDGPPDCNLDLDVDTCVSSKADGSAAEVATECLDDTCANEAVKALYNNGVLLYVVGVGDEVGPGGRWAEVMSKLALSGSGGARDYFAATSTTALAAAFSEIPGRVMEVDYTCTLGIDWEDVPGKFGITKGCDLVSLTFHDISGDVVVPQVPSQFECGDNEGWFWIDQDTEPPVLLEQCTVLDLCPTSCLHFTHGMRDGTLVNYGFGFGCATP
jgi:hypothetical protein